LGLRHWWVLYFVWWNWRAWIRG